MDARLLGSADRHRWNDFVASSPYGHILQSWEWGEIKRHGGWDPIRLGLFDNADLRACAQVLVRALPYGFGNLAYVPKGPVLDYEDNTLLESILSALQSLAAERRVISLKIEPEIVEPSPLQDALVALGLTAASPVQMRSTIWVDLTAGEDQILARQKQKTRYNTRLASKKGVTITSGSLDDVDRWYNMYATTAERDGFSIHSRDYYRLVMEMLGSRGMATLLLAHHEDDLLAGIIVFAFGREAQYMYGASSNVKRNLMAPYLAQWEGMRWARAQGAAVYDLWGVPDLLQENEDLWGVYRHKRGYGGDIVRYIGAYDMVRSPLQHLALERVARPLFKRVARMTSARAQ
ncbi:MAG: peptidoglycan bridge formation glycyltransferase FemA/FemB family protein [Chloroflexota bacterium]